MAVETLEKVGISTDELPASMSVIVQDGYGGPDVFRAAVIDRPSPGKGEVLIEVEAAGVDRGTWHLMTGIPRMARLAFGLRRPRRKVPGLDVAGTIVEVGDGVSDFRPGQRVFGIAKGSFAEFAKADVKKLAPMPESLVPFESAVLGVSGLTAIQALDAARVEAGQQVLIVGASGGVGSYAVKLAVARGAVVTAVCSAGKRRAVAEWGADHVLSYDEGDWKRGARQFDAIIDIGGGTPLRQLRNMLSESGSMVFVGVETGGKWTGGFEHGFINSLRLRWSRQRAVMLVASENAADLRRLGELVNAGQLMPHVHATYALNDAPRAIESLAAGEVTGKLAIRVKDSGASEL